MLKRTVSQDTIRSASLEVLEKDYGEKISTCYQCGKCSAGCPLAFWMDHLPNQIIRMVQLGMEEEALTSRAIWLCASCLTCTVRCPREIDIAKVMDYLRHRAYKKGITSSEETEIPLFNKIFAKNIKLFGRLYEIGLMAMFNLLSKKFFKDVSLLPKMFLKRKIGILPKRIKNAKDVRDIFKRSGELERLHKG